MKILFLSHVFPPSIGGIEASSEFLVNAFVKAGYEVRVMTMTTGGNSCFPYSVIRNPSLLEKLKQHLWADCVYENNPCMRLGWPKLFFGKTSVIALHTWISRIDGSIALIDKVKYRWLARAKKVIAVSTALQQRCWPDAVVIGNSYDDHLFSSRIVDRKRSFVYLGRLVSDKGVELAIHAFNNLAIVDPLAELVTSTLTIIGTGPDRDKLERLVAGLNSPSRIQFLGALQGEALVTELNKHTFQFIPSVWEEPFGIVALEGIACGLIPIGSDGGGLPDAIGRAGVIFKRGQLTSLIAVTKELVQSPTQQAQCRVAATGHLASFNPEAIAQKFMNVFKAVTQS